MLAWRESQGEGNTMVLSPQRASVQSETSDAWTQKSALAVPEKGHVKRSERLLLNHTKTPGFLASRAEEFNLGPETRLGRAELLCSKVLLKYKGDTQSF